MVAQRTRSKSSSKPKVRYVDIKAASHSSFWGFVLAYDPTFHISDFAYDVSTALEDFYVDSQEGKLPKMLMQAPPQHGKSYMAAVLFPAWLLGINPNLKIVIATYDSELASDRCKAIRKIMSSPFYRYVFPSTKLPVTTRLKIQGKNDAFNFDIVNHRGGLKAVSIGMGLTGFSMDIGIIDDPYKDMEAARSPTINRKTITWYSTVFNTRASKVGGTVLMLTRWTTNDLGSEFENMPDSECKKLKFLALDSKGRALVPALFSRRALLNKKSNMSDVNWSAMYQQSPQAIGGNIIRKAWLQTYSILPQKFKKIFIVGDTAFYAHESCDFSVFTVWGATDHHLYLLDMWRKQVDSPDLEPAAIELYFKWKSGIGNTRCTAFYIENKASGMRLIQDLKRKSGVPIIGIERNDKDKYARLQDVLPQIQAEHLFIPLNADFTPEVVKELTFFTGKNDEHDDIVDTVIDALNITYIQKSTTMRDVVRSNKGGRR